LASELNWGDTNIIYLMPTSLVNCLSQDDFASSIYGGMSSEYRRVIVKIAALRTYDNHYVSAGYTGFGSFGLCAISDSIG
jgi:hypothetical protein